MLKTCGFCEKTDGMCYTSNPPKRKCTVTGKFHEYGHICDVPKTNADRIRSMSDDDLAEFIRDVSYECQDAYCGNHCPMCSYPWCSSERTLEWLKQPAE